MWSVSPEVVTAMSHFGYVHATWESAKSEARNTLIARARLRGLIPYSELVEQIHAIDFTHFDTRFFHLLGELSSEEATAGRGMLTAIVVHKDGDMEPGPGFYELAQELGLDISDLLVCWVNECKKVHAAWSTAGRA